MLSSNAYKKCEEYASSILNKYNLLNGPVLIEEIIENEGLNLVPYNLGDDISGVLIIKDSEGTIGINPKDNYLRQRFSMAHELGHFLMHKKPNDLFVDKDFLVKYRHTNGNYSEVERKQEQEANAFAAAILMPIDFIENELKKVEIAVLSEVQLISKLASIFKVSEIAMSYRLTNLNNYH